jgi:alpha-N-acetylglucosamine transferase
MGHTLNTFSCVEKKLALIDVKFVSKSGQDQLKKIGFELIPIDTLNCEMIAAKYHLDIGSEIPGTHNRFYGWNQTQYSKLIYVDPDMLVLSNIDELFATNATFSAALCSPPRARDNWCFNAGLLVITPSSTIFHEIVQSWIDAVRKEARCLDDQNFLFYFYSQTYGWEKLPFLYNVRWDIYYPMKVFHFAGVSKPWRSDRVGANGVVLTVNDMHELWWHYYKQSLTTYKLEQAAV